jgi:DNA primase
LLRHKAAVRVVSLPDGDDPDTFVRAHGRAALEVQLSQAIDLFDRQVQVIERLGWFGNLRKQRLAIDKLLPTIRAARDPLTREMYLARLAEASHLDKSLLASEADEPPAGSRSSRDRGPSSEPDAGPPALDEDQDRYRADEAAAPPSPYAALQARNAWKGKRGRGAGPEWQATTVPPRPRRDEPVERALVRAMLLDRGVVERVAERHGPESFRDPAYRVLFEVLLDAAPTDDLEQIAERLPPQPLQVLGDLTNESQSGVVPLADIALSLDRLDARRLELRVTEIHAELSRATTREAQDALMRERMDLESELRRLLPIRSPRAKPKG